MHEIPSNYQKILWNANCTLVRRQKFRTFDMGS
jgi:hypothetical protein